MTHLIQIGNSHGIRIPKNVIQDAGLAGVELSLTIVAEGLLITPLNKPRQGWDEAFKHKDPKQAANVQLQELSNNFDEEDWEW